ncbi:MAG: hypothetical protein COB09_18825 [Thalassobium sp.]|nr:MAG: hypothetical protein COB09_18825 [Thalassobium sp.]
MASEPIDGSFTVVDEKVVGVSPTPLADFTPQYDELGRLKPFKEISISEYYLAEQYDSQGVDYVIQMKMKMGGFIFVEQGGRLHFCGRVERYQCHRTMNLVVRQYIDVDDAEKIPLSAKQLGTLVKHSQRQLPPTRKP